MRLPTARMPQQTLTGMNCQWIRHHTTVTDEFNRITCQKYRLCVFHGYEIIFESIVLNGFISAPNRYLYRLYISRIQLITLKIEPVKASFDSNVHLSCKKNRPIRFISFINLILCDFNFTPFSSVAGELSLGWKRRHNYADRVAVQASACLAEWLIKI